MIVQEKEYHDGDYLSASDAAQVVSKNSGRVISPDYMCTLIRIGRITGARPFGNRYEYPYSEIKGLVVAPGNAGRRRVTDRPVTSRAVYMQRYREKKKSRGGS